MVSHVELAGACFSVGGTSGAEFLSGAASLRDLSEDLLLLQLRPLMTLSHQTFARLLKVFWFTSYASLNRVVVRETELQQQQQQLSVMCWSVRQCSVKMVPATERPRNKQEKKLYSVREKWSLLNRLCEQILILNIWENKIENFFGFLRLKPMFFFFFFRSSNSPKEHIIFPNSFILRLWDVSQMVQVHGCAVELVVPEEKVFSGRQTQISLTFCLHGRRRNNTRRLWS